MQLNVQKGTNINEVNVRSVTFCKQELNKDRDSLGRNTSSDFRGLGRVVISRAKAAPAKRSEKPLWGRKWNNPLSASLRNYANLICSLVDLCRRSETLRANMLVIKTSNFQGATNRAIVLETGALSIILA